MLFTFNYDPATQLQFAANGQPPATAQPGTNFASPNPVIVDAEDVFGNIATTYTGPVTITLAGGASGLGGTVTVNAVAGVATFTNLSIAADGTYNLLGSSPSLATTNPRIDFHPHRRGRHTALHHPATARHRAGRQRLWLEVGAETSSETRRRYSPARFRSPSANNPGGSDPTGVAATVPVVGAVATFSGLTLNKVGQGYTLKVTAAGITSVTTNPFNVTNAPADHLVITPANEPPSTVTAGQTFAMTVMAEDRFGNLDTGFSGTVSVSIASGTLTGTTPVTVSNGLAVFNNLAIDTAGKFQILASSNPALTTVTSTSIQVNPDTPSQLVWDSEPPSSVVHNFPFGVRTRSRRQVRQPGNDRHRHRLDRVREQPDRRDLGGDTTVDLVSGVASSTTLSISNVGNGYTLQGTYQGITSPVSTPIDVTPTPATALAISVQPPSSVAVHQTIWLPGHGA